MQTALLAVQAARTDGFPWATWAGSLNLFVWLVVGAYLFWGCRPRYRLLGLAVMPLAAVLFLVAGLGGGTETGEQSHYGNLFLTLHVGFVLAAFAGFTLAAALAGLYLIEERRLQRRSADILRLKLPSLVTLEKVTSQAIAISLPLLTLGLAIGIVRLYERGGGDRRADGGDDPRLARLRRVRRAPADRPLRSAPRARRLRGRDRRSHRARREPLLRLSLVGISHHVAPVELRERVALPLDRAAALARDLGDAVCLSTCNRTEIYRGGDSTDRALATLEEIAGEPLGPVAYRMHDEAAAVHLFRVSAGLDSLVPGESEILGQVKAAYEAASAGPLLDRVFRQALQLGKRVRSETAIGESPASVPSAAAALAEQVFGDLAGRRVLLIGAGRIGELAAGSLSARGATISYVVNRSPEAAQTLAARFGAEPLRGDQIASKLGEVDVVLTSTSAPEFVVRAGDVPSRRRQPLFFIDIAVPRDVDPAVHQLDGCYLYDIDDLEAVVAETLAGRRVEAESAELLVVEEADALPRAWQASLDVVPAIASLRAHAEEIRAAELAKTRRPARARAPDDRGRDCADAQQAAAPADRSDEGGGARGGRDGIRRGRAASVRPRGEAVREQPPRMEPPLPTQTPAAFFGPDAARRRCGPRRCASKRRGRVRNGARSHRVARL